jgi:UPF0716 protein FxsA
MFLKLFLLFTCIPLIELYILMKLGAAFGVITTLALVVGTGILGAYLAKREGVRVLFKIQEETRSGRLPAREMIDGFLVLVSGILLITPGLLTDIAGFVLLFPFTRNIFVSYILSKIKQNMEKGTFSNVQYHIQD